MIHIFNKLRRRNSWKRNPGAGAVLLPIPEMLRQQSDQEQQRDKDTKRTWSNTLVSYQITRQEINILLGVILWQ